MNLYIAGSDTPHNKSKLDTSIKRGFDTAICELPLFSNVDDYKWDVVYNCSCATTDEALKKLNAKVYINGNCKTFNICADKWETYKYLKDKFVQAETSLENEFNYPVVMKYSKGSFGYQVELAHNEKEEREILLRFHNLAMSDLLYKLPVGKIIYQKYIESSSGIDICAYVVGDEVVACMKRENKDDFRSHTFRGGVATNYELTEDEKHLCVNIAHELGLDICSINFLLDNKELILCEVNANPGLDVISQATGVDVTNCIFDLIKKRLEELK